MSLDDKLNAKPHTGQAAFDLTLCY
jgi:hypothetical protein